MITNTDITIYSRTYNPSTRLDEWKKIYVPEAWWFKDEKAILETDGIRTSDMYTVRITDLNIKIKKDDYIIKGNCQKEIQTIKDFNEYEIMHVTAVNYNQFGDTPHIKVGGI